MPGQYEYSFKETLKSVNRSQKKRKVKSVKWLYPIANEKKYYKLILETVRNSLVNFTEKWLKENLDRLLNQKVIVDNANTATSFMYGTVSKQDSWIDDLETFINQLRGESEKITGEEKQSTDSAWKILSAAFAALYLFNKKQFNKSTQSVLGFPFQTQDPWLNEMKKAWEAENYSLIKGLSDDYINQINKTAWNGFRSGLSNKEIMKQIKSIDESIFGPKYKIDPKTGKRKRVQSRAELLARDQIGKLNGELTKRHMEDIGQDVYEWNTAFDERVRGRPGGKYPKAVPSHWLMQGKLGKWSDNSVYAEKPAEGQKIVWLQREGKMPTGIPGSDIQCRCTATTWWGESLGEINKEIKKEQGIPVPPETKLEKEEPEKKETAPVPPVVPEPKKEKTIEELNPENYVKESSPLTDKQKNQLRVYKGKGYEEINNYLLTGEPLEEVEDLEGWKKYINEKVSTIDSAFKKSKLNQDIEVFRGINFPGVSNISKDIIDQNLKLTGNYMSTSTVKDYAKKFTGNDLNNSAILKIKAKKGTTAINMEQFGVSDESEHEILFPRNLKLKITNVIPGEGKNHTVIEGELINEE